MEHHGHCNEHKTQHHLQAQEGFHHRVFLAKAYGSFENVDYLEAGNEKCRIETGNDTGNQYYQNKEEPQVGT